MPQISATEFYALPLRVHTFLADVPLHDVWAVDLPAHSDGVTLCEFLRRASQCGCDTADTEINRLPPVARALFRLRFGPHASYEAVDDVLAKIDSDDKRLIGRELAFTFEEYKRMGIEPLGRRRAKHPSTIRPFNATEAWIQAHLKEFKKSRNAAAHKEQRTKLAEAQKAVEDLDDRSSAILAFLQHSNGLRSTAEVVDGVRKSRAFAGLTKEAIHRTVLRLVKPPSKLGEMIILTEGKTKNGQKTFLMEPLK